MHPLTDMLVKATMSSFMERVRAWTAEHGLATACLIVGVFGTWLALTYLF